MLTKASLLVCFKEYPHVDIPERADDLLWLAAEAAAVDVEIITIYLGAELTEAGAADVIDALRRAFADAEVEVVSGGQAHYDYIISLE